MLSLIGEKGFCSKAELLCSQFMLKIPKTFSELDIFQYLPTIFILVVVPISIDLLEFVQNNKNYLIKRGNHEQNNQTDRLSER